MYVREFPGTVGPQQPDSSALDSTGDAHLDQFFTQSCDLFALASLRSNTWVRVNPAFESILGWHEGDLIHKIFFDIVHPADIDRSQLAVSNLLGGKSVTNIEIRMLCKGGGYRWIAWHTVPRTNDRLAFGVGRDITRKRRNLRSLRALNHRIRRANEELSQFANHAGHDLEEPLRTLSLHSELLLRDQEHGLSEHISEGLLTISRETDKMRALLRSLREFGTVSNTIAAEKQFEAVFLEKVFEDVLMSLESAIRECSAHITHDSLPTVDGHRVQLCRLFQNLLSNSLKYRCPDRPVHIHVGVQQSEGEWLFEVTDNGSGFKPECAEWIFAPFKRLHSHHQIPGTGLGLTICRQILKRHGGRIWAESGLEGATLRFTLPQHPPTSAQEK